MPKNWGKQRASLPELRVPAAASWCCCLSTEARPPPCENNKIYLLHRAVCHVSVNLNTHNAFVYAVFSGALSKLSLRVLPQPPNKTGAANFSSALLFVSLPSLSTNFVPPVNDLSSTRDFLRCCAFQCSALLLLLSSAAFAFQRPRTLGRSATRNRREHHGETIVAGRASCEPRRRLERREICRRYFSPFSLVYFQNTIQFAKH